MPFFNRPKRVNQLISAIFFFYSFSFLTSGLAQAQKETGEIVMWSRKRGAHHDTPNPEKTNEKIIKLSNFKQIKRKMFDAQYGRTETYFGIPLSKIIHQYKKQKHDDMVILHFSNRMAIPLELDGSKLKEVFPFIALQLCPNKGPCDKVFPAISKEEIDSPYQDPRPINFNNNKIVVTTLRHPDLIEPKNPVFSPWKYVDSIVGLEFVNKKAYQKQFSFQEEEGEKVFWHRCQFCHGVRLIGSRMGWDFVNPLPIFEKRRPEVLLNHVKYPKIRAKQLGLMMPHQADMELPEAETLWKWLKAAAQKPSPEYLP